ncbi:hypothetical protein ABZ027_24050 [Streptomyces sp. NPDC006332]|uniref:hypothetical protein n=1 Tax=Streptomyces sp. NPDC006332 TaxID=3155456 RepID=UPI0033B67238
MDLGVRPAPAAVRRELSISLRLDSFSPSFDLRGHRRLVRAWQPERYPDVDVFLPVCGEPLSCTPG